MSERVSKLGVDDEEFLVASLIERCPKGMMLRELVMNAVEAAANTQGGRGKIWIGATEVDGVPKLTIRNSGPGMDCGQLRQMCDIAASIGKQKGLNQNFGMGAKVASLPSNHRGVRYRSCSQGRVFEVVIGKIDGLYGRLMRPDANGQMADVIEATHFYNSAELASDWTEVVLLGMEAQQDTLQDPYAFDPVVPSFWIPLALYHRFYRLPSNVEIILADGVHWFGGERIFQSLHERIPKVFTRQEAVQAEDGLVIHYVYDPEHSERPWENGSSEAALQTSGSIAALIFRDEFYDVRTGSPWIFDAPKFGIAFGARHVSVYIELPDTYPAAPDAYRQFLGHVTGEQERLQLELFIEKVRSCRPQWLLDLFDELGRNSSVSTDVVSELKNLREQLDVHLYVHDDQAAAQAAEVAAATGEFIPWVEPELEIVLLSDERDIEDRWLKDRAACFYRNTRQLFINTNYESISQLANELETLTNREFPEYFEADLMRKQAHAAAVEAIARRLGRVCVLWFGEKRAD
jgi:hypothetical protein